ncbi:MAG: MATE family efflux transporter [Mogibacterium sp.]|nr:MATE family efflux transporter [Mogibacterium sp.]
MNKKNEILTGSIWKAALKFAIPLAITGMLQQLFNAADVAVVGRFVGKEAMAAVGSNVPVVGLIVNLFVGISVGSNVVIARCIGEGKQKKTEQAVHTSIVLALICGVIVAVVGSIIAGPIIKMMGVPAEVADYSALYLRIYFLGSPFILLYNFESAIFRSYGDTKTPLFCLLTGGILNVCFNIFFILKLGMTVDGVALATVIANAVSSAMLLFFLLRGKDGIKVEIRKLGLDLGVTRNVLQIGLPSGIQSMVFSISNLCIQSAINSLGADIMAASSAAFTVEIFVFFILNSFGQACVTFMGQNYGAGNKQRCREVVKKVTTLSLIITMGGAVFIIIFSDFFVSIFNQDPTVIQFGTYRVRFLMAGQFLCVIMECLSGALRGLGKSMQPALITLVGVCGSRIAWVYTVFASSRTWATLLTVYPISWLLAVIALVIVYRRTAKKMLE